MDFIGKLGQYKIIKTEDNTITLWSEFFDENCHNLSGAFEETIHNYIEGTEITKQLLSSKDVHVLDVGFGLGIGLKALIETVKKNSLEIPSKKITYTSIELDEELLKWSLKETFGIIDFNLIDHGNYKSAELIFLINQALSIKAQILIGDGRKTLLEAYKTSQLPSFSAIFQDAFSPKKNPALWSWQWFVDLYTMSDAHVLLATYSSSVSIRKSLLKAGWVVSNAKGFGQKRTMTKASKQGQTVPELYSELIKSKIVEISDD